MTRVMIYDRAGTDYTAMLFQGQTKRLMPRKRKPRNEATQELGAANHEGKG